MALTPAQGKARNTGGVARVLRIRHGEYQVPGSQDGRVHTVLGTDQRALSCDCPAGRRGLDCDHRAAVAVRCARVGRGGSGAGHGLGPREGRAPVPGHHAAVRSHEGVIPGPCKERVASGDAGRPLEPLDGTAPAAGGVGCRVPECAPDGTPARPRARDAFGRPVLGRKRGWRTLHGTRLPDTCLTRDANRALCSHSLGTQSSNHPPSS